MKGRPPGRLFQARAVVAAGAATVMNAGQAQVQGRRWPCEDFLAHTTVVFREGWSRGSTPETAMHNVATGPPTECQTSLFDWDNHLQNSRNRRLSSNWPLLMCRRVGTTPVTQSGSIRGYESQGDCRRHRAVHRSPHRNRRVHHLRGEITSEPGSVCGQAKHTGRHDRSGRVLRSRQRGPTDAAIPSGVSATR
jgi:hypothetical protein